MPFTPSHAVVALPFVRTPLVPAAIAVGAMTPDLPLFVRGLPLHYGLTHTFAWLPVTVLVALALLLVWRCVLRPAARELSPTWLARRLPHEWDADALASLRTTFGEPASDVPGARRAGGAARGRAIAILVGSLLLGVVTHIVWDLFTHEGRWGVEAVPVLDEQWGPLVGYKWLQHGSSVLGLGILGVWAIAWLARRRRASSPHRVLPAWTRWAWIAALPVVMLSAWMWGLAVLGPFDARFTAQHLAYRVLPPACAAWGALTVALSVWVQARRRS